MYTEQKRTTLQSRKLGVVQKSNNQQTLFCDKSRNGTEKNSGRIAQNNARTMHELIITPLLIN